MHCPNCGTEAPAGQKFCRACGVSLKRDGQLLSNTEDKDAARERRRLQRLESTMKLGWYIIVLAFWLLAAILIGWMGIDIISKSGNIGAGVVLLVLAAGMIAAEGLLVYYAALQAEISTRQSAQPAAPSAATTNQLLSKDQSWIAMSVTEQTTAQLKERIESRSSDQ